MKMKRVISTLLALGSLCSAQVYQENDGLVVMEMESTSSALGLWEQQSSLSGYSGDGYLQFLGNTFELGPPTSPLEFTFKINRAGLYYLHLHCAKETHEGRSDVANDCYVRVEGDYTAGPGPHSGHGDNAALSLLQSDTKYFGGASNSWKWENGQNSSGGNGNLDPGGESNKRVAVYDFKAGETYTLVVSGRSKFFRINRVVFRHSATSASVAQNLSTPESETSGGGTRIVYDAIDDFGNLNGGDVPYYQDNGNDALAIAANIVANRTGFARASRTFDGPTGSYDIRITTLTEEDGESTYRLLVNGVEVRSFMNLVVFDPPNSPLDLEPHLHTWSGVQIPAGATIAIESNAHTNGEIPEAGGTAYARGRWREIEFTSSSSLVQPPAGRIAYVADGNSPDPDDIGANAVVFGLLNGAGLQDRLVHFSHSCDLVKASNISSEDELRRQNKMHAQCAEGIAFFGPFPNLPDYYNCRTEQQAAVNDLRDAINVSTAADPLWIIEAGEPDIIGYALQASDASKHQHVHVVSHHPANDNSGDFFEWQDILDFNVTEHQIGDQNVGLQVLISTGLWDWAENHVNPAMTWILDELKYAEADGVVGFQTNKYDCSDAGMIYWWITGANQGGDKLSTPVEIREMLLFGGLPVVDLEAPVAHWLLDEGQGAVAGDSSGNGFTGTILNGATWGSDAVRDSFLSFDGTDDRVSTLFSHALSSSDDFTWAWWANPAVGTHSGSIMVGNRYPQGAPNETFEFIKFTQGGAQFSNTSDVPSIEKYNYAALERGTWHHYAMVKDGTSYQWYVDGVAQGNPVTFSYDEGSSIPFLIGGDDDGSGTKVNEHFEGGIDDVVLYQRALTASELMDVQNGIYFPAPPAIELLAGWDTWDSNTAPVANVTGAGITATATATTATGSWNTSDDGSSGRGSSGDTTWGSFDGDGVSASDVTSGTGANMTASNGVETAELTLTIANDGGAAWDLDSFHMDVIAFRPNAPRAYQLEVVSGDLTNGVVFTSADDAITQFGGNLSGNHDDHDEIDLSFSGLADSTLEAGEAAVIRVSFSSGTGSGGGHHLFLDNVAVSGTSNQISELENWRFEYFGTTENTGMAADHFDANDDGESNLLEFATGQEPYAETCLETPLAFEVDFMEFRYRRNQAAVGDGMVFQVEWSDTLLDGSWSALGVVDEVDFEDSGDLEVQNRVAIVPKGSVGRRFVRMRVELP